MMNRLLHIILLTGALLMAALPAAAQSKREITPVESDEGKPQQPVLHYYDKHGEPLKEPVLFVADLDTVSRPSAKPVYPLLNSVSIGANFFDAVMLAFGQKHASVDLWGELSLWNWFFPTVEMGLGFGNNHPEGANFRYKAKPSFYIRAGFNYNFMYKSNPDYSVFLGLRAGYSHFTYDITGITIDSGYWGQSNKFDLLGQTSSVFFGQFVAGVKVKIYKNISLGWSGRYNFKFHSTNSKNATPWFVPGMGAKNALSATFSIIYTIPLSKNVPITASSEAAPGSN